MKLFKMSLTLIRDLGLCLIILTFVSCDPAQSIRISNETTADAKVTFVFKKGIMNISLGKLPNQTL